MDGTLGVGLLVLALADMGVNYCPTDCFLAETVDPSLAVSGGALSFQGDVTGGEFYVRRDLGVTLGPFQPSVGASLGTSGETWVGAGVLYTIDLPGQFYAQGTLMPGLYAKGNGPDLGNALEFRSGIEFGYEADTGIRYGLSLDHRSNGGLSETNPGLETLQFRITFPRG